MCIYLKETMGKYVEPKATAKSALGRWVQYHGRRIPVGSKVFQLQSIVYRGLNGEADLTGRGSSFKGILCPQTKIPNHPNAEVWSIQSAGQEVAAFAVVGHAITPVCAI